MENLADIEIVNYNRVNNQISNLLINRVQPTNENVEKKLNHQTLEFNLEFNRIFKNDTNHNLNSVKKKEQINFLKSNRRRSGILYTQEFIESLGDSQNTR